MIIKKETIVYILACIFLLHHLGYGQEIPDLDFEQANSITSLGYNAEYGNKNYAVSIDSTIAWSGKNSGLIAYSGDAPGFEFLSYALPAKYQGKKIKLSGYLKTENVAEGWAGLVLRIDPAVSFGNMQDDGVKGTTDWRYYEIELDLMPEKARQIIFGGLLVGKGKVWIDDLKVTIDGIDIENAPLKPLMPVEKDREFDSGSNISFRELDKKKIDDLTLLGNIWGFLKYHHPEIGKGNYNWDYELFRFIPKYTHNKNNAKRDKILLNWINGLGEIQKCTDCVKVSEDAFLKPDFTWLLNSNISQKLKAKIKYIHANRHQGEHYYVSMAPNIGNPNFDHEKSYSDMPFPDAGFRLLALYRYWNIIHYFYPYKHLTNNNWNTVLSEYIPRFINAKNELEYETVSLEIIGEIGDTHANLYAGNNVLNDRKGKFFPPFHLRFIENQLVVSDYFNPELDTVSLKIGDIITHINGKSAEEVVDKMKKYYPASNQVTQLRNISYDILRSDQKELEITYRRNHDENVKKIMLYNPDSLNFKAWYNKLDREECYKIIEGNIGYINLKTIDNKKIRKIKDTLKNTKGIIVDIRNYPSAFVPFTLGPFFVSDTTAFVKITKGSLNTPGEFTFKKTNKIPGSENSYEGKVILLVNELTQSMAEYTAMALRVGNNVTVIGSTTAGADGNVSSFYLPGGLLTRISGVGIYYPDGTETQRIGIVPDIEVKPTIDGIREKKDEVLEKAIQLINMSK